jgi:hypothetical protein
MQAAAATAAAAGDCGHQTLTVVGGRDHPHMVVSSSMGARHCRGDACCVVLNVGAWYVHCRCWWDASSSSSSSSRQLWASRGTLCWWEGNGRDGLLLNHGQAYVR